MDKKNKLVIITFIATLVTSIGLFIGGFFCPPMGVIDSSILQAAGILLGFVPFAELPDIVRMISEGKKFKFTHGNVTIESNGDSNESN